jgi:hypothetical protein
VTPAPTPTPAPQPARLTLTSQLRYAGAAGVIAADRCPHTRQAGISDKSRVLIVLVGAGGAIPAAGPAATCTMFGADSWLSKARNLGFDVYVVTYQDPNALTQRQAFGVIELVRRLQTEGRITPEADVAMFGVSWGGLISRYALQYMETHGPAHNVDLWVTGDSPLQGAYVPIGIQQIAQYFADDFGVKSAVTSKTEMLDTPMTRQLLIYHYTRTGQSGVSWTLEHTALFTTELKNALGGFPHAGGLRRVGVSDGRADGRPDAPPSGAQILAWRSDNVDVVGKGEVVKTYDTTTVTVTAVDRKWRIRIKTTTTILGQTITLFDHTYNWAVTARVDVRALALATRTSGTVFEARPSFTLDGKAVDLLNETSVLNLIKPLVEAQVPGVARPIWNLVADKALAPVASGIVGGAKAQIDKYPWMKFRNFAINAPYSYDGGAGGRSDKSGVLIDLINAAELGAFVGGTVRNHAFVPIHSALMLENTPGVAFDPASVAAGIGQAPKTPFDRIVYATTNLNHLDAGRSLVFPTVVTELTELVQRGGG